MARRYCGPSGHGGEPGGVELDGHIGAVRSEGAVVVADRYDGGIGATRRVRVIGDHELANAVVGRATGRRIGEVGGVEVYLVGGVVHGGRDGCERLSRVVGEVAFRVGREQRRQVVVVVQRVVGLKAGGLEQDDDQCVVGGGQAGVVRRLTLGDVEDSIRHDRYAARSTTANACG